MKTFDIDECAEFLKVDRSTALRLAGIGDIPGAKIGRSWVFLLDDLITYLRGKVSAQTRQRASEQEVEQALTTVKTVLPVATSSHKNNRKPLPSIFGV